MEAPIIKAVFCHPTKVREWQPFTGYFELPPLHSIIDQIINLISPDFRSAVMDLPDYCGVALSKAVYVHCYCHPDNFLAGTELTWILGQSLFDNREPENSFLNLYRVCEELRVAVSADVRRIRNRAVHPWNATGNRNCPPTMAEFSKAIQEMRKCIHRSGKSVRVPRIDLQCESCNRGL